MGGWIFLSFSFICLSSLVGGWVGGLPTLVGLPLLPGTRGASSSSSFFSTAEMVCFTCNVHMPIGERWVGGWVGG